MARLRPSSVSRSRRATRASIRPLALESLESRCLLSVSAGAQDWEEAVDDDYVTVDWDRPSELIAPGVATEADSAWVAKALAETNETSTVASLHFSATDMHGNPLDRIQVGDTFLLNVEVEDGRMQPQGVFSMYFDLLYDSALMEVIGEIDHSDIYQSMPMGDSSRPGIVNDAGGFSGSIKPVGGGALPLYSIPMRAIAPGTALIAGDPADCNPVTAIGVYGEDESIQESRIDYGQTTLQIGSSGKSQTTVAELAKVGADGCVKLTRPVPPMEYASEEYISGGEGTDILDKVYSSTESLALLTVGRLASLSSQPELQVLWLMLSNDTATTSSAGQIELVPLIETTVPEPIGTTSAESPSNPKAENGQDDSAETDQSLDLLDEVYAELGAAELTTS